MGKHHSDGNNDHDGDDGDNNSQAEWTDNNDYHNIIITNMIQIIIVVWKLIKFI